MTEPVDIRSMTAADLDLVLDWAAAEGWNPGVEDAACFRAQDPGGFLLAVVGGVPAASISVVGYGAGYGFLGLYIAAPAYRGRGIAWRLWQAGMDRMGGRVVGLDGVVAQQANYRKSGFEPAFRHIRHAGAPGLAAPRDPRLIDITSDLAGAVIGYDRPFFPGPRDTFLRLWLKSRTRHGCLLVEDGAIAGYGVARACRQGWKIGPLFADTPAGADLLFRRLAAHAKGDMVFLDLPAPNAEAIALAQRHGMAPVFETARMYRGPQPALPLPRTYGVTTLELG